MKPKFIKKEWRILLTIALFLFILIVILIPKIELTIIEKSDKWVCECNCSYQELIDWKNINISYPDWEVYVYNSTIWEECKGCWKSLLLAGLVAHSCYPCFFYPLRLVKGDGNQSGL